MSKHVIETTLFIDASAEAIYALLTDHAHLDSFPKLGHSVLLREGRLDPNGKGAERQLIIAMYGWLPIRFTEDITLADSPLEYHYQVSKARLMLGPLPLWAGLRHDGGQVRIVPEANGCRVHWTSTFEILVPLLGGWLARKMKAEGESVFQGVLQQARERLENNKSAGAAVGEG